MKKSFKKIEEGFTIVETLIVLAIAALIITIVLIAVPDLQRSARNTDILHDAQNIASAIQSYESNNDGNLPTNVTDPLNSPTVTVGAAGSDQASAQVQSSDSVFFESGSAKEITYTPNQATATNAAIGAGDIIVDVKAECGTNGYKQTPVNSGTDPGAVVHAAIFYPSENGTAKGGDVDCTQI